MSCVLLTPPGFNYSLIASLANWSIGTEGESMGKNIFFYTTYPISTLQPSFADWPLAANKGFIGEFIACTLIFAIYLAAFMVIKSEWNNVRSHKRLRRLQECRSAIEMETMANDSEVCPYGVGGVDRASSSSDALGSRVRTPLHL